MKSYDQLRFMYHDVIPGDPAKANAGKPVKDARHIPVKTQFTKSEPSKAKTPLKPKEARLVFYSHLASPSGPTIRVQRPGNIRTEVVKETDYNEIPDSFMKSLDFEFLDEGPNKSSERTMPAWVNNIPGQLTTTLSSVVAFGKASTFKTKRFFVNRYNNFPKVKLNLVKKDGLSLKKPNLNNFNNKKTYLLVTLFILFTATLIFGINQLIDNSRQRESQQSQAQAEWEQSKMEWECALARYEAKQNNISLDESKEQACVNIN